MEKIDLDNYSMYVVKAIHMPYPDRAVELPLEVVARDMQEARELVFALAEYPVKIEGVFYHSTARAFYEEIYGPLNEEEEKQIEKQIAQQVSVVR